ncbi:hypothetical protein VCR12J2_640192 [Vibrio coralliirubri]|uniref:hypothetical protein n=1 Tax=Vibrio coralliirubri TaxID=1516159 RepID=UPI00063A5B87|nr:hypothetical protein [Vibrio coralliirubri]CDU04559.1 hypothetical protein VCR12J2_640192 [Vibrio coralliirubri]
MKYLGFILAFCIWIFANGFWEMAKAPEHYSSCQQIEWAQNQNKSTFRPDESLALWVLQKIKCDKASRNNVSKDMSQNPMAMAYICWQLANQSGRETDSDLFAQMISMVRKSPEFKPELHIEFVGYATQEVLKMDSEQRQSVYNAGCSVPLNNIKRASEQGMLN